jgi:hypothetical protein
VVLADLFFPHAPLATVVAAALTVPTQLLLTVGKTALQGLGRAAGRGHRDRRRGDRLPALLPARRPGRRHGLAGIVLGLALADIAVAGFAWRAVARKLGWRRLGLSRTTAGGAGHEPTWPGRSRATACAASSVA